MKELVGALLVATVASACGSSPSVSASERLTKDQYQQRIYEVRRHEEIVAVRLFDDLVTGPRPQAECAQKAKAFHAELETIVAKVAALSPPEDVADLQDEFLAAARDSIDMIGEAAEDVEAGKLACGEELNRVIYGLGSTERAERALSRIESKGYIIFGE
jgi:hypothetical protein